MSFWDRVAELPGLSPVVDYQAHETSWARYITALHLRALERAIDVHGNDRFLDYGCGVGRIARWLAGRAGEVVAVDPSAPMVEAARRRCAHLPNLRFEVLGEDLEALGSAFDGATAVWVLQHILDDAGFERTLARLARSLREGAAAYTIDRLCRESIVEEAALEYLRLRSLRDYRSACERNGFVVERCSAISVGEQVLGRPWLTRLVQRGVAPIGPTVSLDLAWAARQSSPYVADYIFTLRRATPALARSAR